jgi:hypothetical protein
MLIARMSSVNATDCPAGSTLTLLVLLVPLCTLLATLTELNLAVVYSPCTSSVSTVIFSSTGCCSCCVSSISATKT